MCQLYLPASSPRVKDQCHTCKDIAIIIFSSLVMIIFIILKNPPDHLNGVVEPNVTGVAAARKDPAESFQNSISFAFKSAMIVLVACEIEERCTYVLKSAIHRL